MPQLIRQMRQDYLQHFTESFLLDASVILISHLAFDKIIMIVIIIKVLPMKISVSSVSLLILLLSTVAELQSVVKKPVVGIEPTFLRYKLKVMPLYETGRCASRKGSRPGSPVHYGCMREMHGTGFEPVLTLKEEYLAS